MHHEPETLGDLEVRTALMSTFDKSGLLEFAQNLEHHGIKLIATGGTFAALQNAGLSATPVEKVGRFPEMLEGRVKTLQPEIFAGILARKSSQDHMRQIGERGIASIDMVVCNFYAFEEEAKTNSKLDELVEMIDIGGPSIVRAAAKNFESACVVPSPRFYAEVASELDFKNAISLDTRRRLALEALEVVADYDISIYNTLSRRFHPEKRFPKTYFLSASRFEAPKYGENPGQEAMIYSVRGASGGVREWKQISGDPRSYNNYLDIAAAFEVLQGFEHSPAAATVKHGQISGFAFSASLSDAYRMAHACDPEADFGNTTVLNRTVDVATARLLGKNEGSDDGSVYTEIVLAPAYETEAVEILKRKQRKKIRIIQAENSSNYPFDLKLIQGLALLQDSPNYRRKLDDSKVSVETFSKPTKQGLAIMLGLWEVVRRVDSNAIVIGSGTLGMEGSLEKLWTLGVGTFRKRNGATKIALDNAGERAQGAFCASDGFFPFPDSVELLGDAGVKGIIQPGGSVNDKKVIEAADKYSMSMLFTHERAFKH